MALSVPTGFSDAIFGPAVNRCFPRPILETRTSYLSTLRPSLIRFSGCVRFFIFLILFIIIIIIIIIMMRFLGRERAERAQANVQEQEVRENEEQGETSALNESKTTN